MTHHILDGCIGCTACAVQCPAFAIEAVPGKKHVVHVELCIDCGVCGVVCPVPGVVIDEAGQAVTRVPRSVRPLPAFHPDDCNGCGACVDLCPFQVIGLTGPRFQSLARLIAESGCVHCGECVRACPRHAVRLLPPAGHT